MPWREARGELVVPGAGPAPPIPPPATRKHPPPPYTQQPLPPCLTPLRGPPLRRVCEHLFEPRRLHIHRRHLGTVALRGARPAPRHARRTLGDGALVVLGSQRRHYGLPSPLQVLPNLSQIIALLLAGQAAAAAAAVSRGAAAAARPASRGRCADTPQRNAAGQIMRDPGSHAHTTHHTPPRTHTHTFV